MPSCRAFTFALQGFLVKKIIKYVL